MLDKIEERMGYRFKERKYLETAITHTSYLNEHRQAGGEDNERLEFLGDAVLNLLITEFLFDQRGDKKEGVLSFLRSRIVETEMCARFLKSLELEDHLLLGKGEKRNLASSGESLFANFFEALLGAIFLDGGLEGAKAFFWHHFKDAVNEIVTTPERNWKADLQDRLQKEFRVSPTYELIEEKGPDHSKTFRVAALANGKRLGVGVGATKKEAQQKAAMAALEKLNGNCQT